MSLSASLTTLLILIQVRAVREGWRKHAQAQTRQLRREVCLNYDL